MSLISGLVTFPVGFLFGGYKSICFKLPSEWRSSVPSERVHRDDQALNTVPGSQIKTAMQPFLDKSGIRQDLVFIERPNLGFCQAVGTNLFTKGDAAVLVAPDFYDADKDACSWVMKHEISHIKHNDFFTIHCVPGICQLAASIFGMCSLAHLPTLALASIVGTVSLVLFSQWREAEADNFAINNGSDEELKGGRRLLMAMQEANIEARNTVWEQVTVSSNGDQRLDILHPSITSRIQKIEKALHARNVEVDTAAERGKLDRLKTYMANEKRNTEQFVESMGGTLGVMRAMWSF